ncbi:spermatogenesis-associated protein 48 [Bufo gargarizans]|uniref:spermatogenesis-associated protein 48 n=1 Tax=Bufo gargarizans TaxID=30331 RepID=UPI001CF4018E|nr:spermatogenesis-associated protein 48 [Bufo gargarizans]
MVVTTTAHEVSRDAEHRRRSDFHQPYAMLSKSRPDSRANFQYYVDSTASSPEMPGYCLHPLRDDVPLVDPCSGFMSPGADADVSPVTGKTIPCLADISYVKPQEADPWEQSCSSHNMRCKTAPPAGKVPPGPLQKPIPWAQEESDLHHLIHKAGTQWNSVSRPDAALRAALGGWTSKVKANPQVTRGPGTSLTQTFQLQQKSAVSWSRDDMVKKYMYTSSTQRAYEDVSWDTKLPAKIKPPETTIEKMPDPVSHHFTLKRYASQPEVWQVAGGMWDRFQTRMFHGHKKPLDFISPYPRMDHIPGYCGFTGSTNSEDIDNPNSSFIPFTKMRTVQPQYTNTAHTPNIPGYTGRVHWIAIHPAHSNVPSYLSSPDTKVNRSFPGSRIGTAFKHQGPLSRMVTTVSPCNPFNKVEKENVQ